jgi:hypothetical protein
MSFNKSIGGYFELELRDGKEYHANAIKLNTGRNAFEYLLRVKNYRKVYLPYYICGAMLEPINKLKLDYEFYSIDNNFFPIFNFSIIKKNDAFVYVNYFGICDDRVKKIAGFCKNLILDNSQAFFSKPFNGINVFYSPRKFFGVPDGAYLYTNKILKTKLEQDYSCNRFSHLIGRIEKGAESFHPFFRDNENLLEKQPIKKMSNITKKILQSIDYKNVSAIRIRNFQYLHKYLRSFNQIEFSGIHNYAPMVYPFLIENGKVLKKKFIKNSVFIATYWPNVKGLINGSNSSFELSLVNDLISLPIDQRYDLHEMVKLLKIIKENI